MFGEALLLVEEGLDVVVFAGGVAVGVEAVGEGGFGVEFLDLVE